MLEINRKCGVCQRFFKRPAAARVPVGYCTACWEKADRHMQERDDLADLQAAGHNINATQHLRDALAYGLGVASISKEGVEHHPLFEVMKMPDPAAHYRWEIRRRITDEDIARGYVAVKVDPYRIARVAGVGGGPHEHSVKKLLRGEAKGHEARELIREVRCCLDRWEEMIAEDEEEARCR